MQKQTTGPEEQSALPESRPLTLAENLVLTAKLLGGGGALVGAIWALDRFVG
jgi:hypothetical protein